MKLLQEKEVIVWIIPEVIILKYFRIFFIPQSELGSFISALSPALFQM